MGYGLIEVSAFITALAFVGLVAYFTFWSAE